MPLSFLKVVYFARGKFHDSLWCLAGFLVSSSGCEVKGPVHRKHKLRLIS